jgi:twitching motility two-component system response regulator PilH
MANSLKVLIVDDAEVDRTHLERIVVGAGHVALLAVSGEHALERAVADKPDLIFMDVNMPGMGGYDATRKLRDNEQTKHIPLVIVSSKGEKADKVWAQILGARGHVSKPYTPEAIIAELSA